jgi:SAM-dependent methyltransferase
MITFRREHLDKQLKKHLALMTGHVLDVGGRRNKKRGLFRPPLEQVIDWKYANPDPLAEPDFLAPAEKLPVPDKSVDLVVMTEVLEYVSEPKAAVSEIYRVLKAGGSALISMPLHSPVHGDWQFDQRRLTRRGLEILLADCGFKAVAIAPMGGMGAVYFDLAEAATGYGHPSAGSLAVKITRKLLFLAVPFFRFLDWFCLGSVEYVTTGYFVVAKK